MKKLLGILMALILLCLAGAALADVAIDEAHFPDAAFRAFVKTHQDSDGDGVLSDTETQAAEIDCTGQGIASLKGIEYFTALQKLVCIDNQLTELDLSGNTALTDLDCGRNQLTGLNVSQNTGLIGLCCYDNRLTELDVSQNTGLVILICDDNQLSRLDVSKNTKLIQLYFDRNQLTELDVSENNSLHWLDCSHNPLGKLDVSKNTELEKLYCVQNQLAELDVSKNTALIELECTRNQLTELDVTNAPVLRDAVQHNERLSENYYGIDDKYDYFGINEEGNCYLSVDQFVRVIAGSFISEPTAAPEPAAPTTATVGALKYSLKDGEATVTAPKSKSAKKITIPATIKVGDKTYKVTEIKANAFKGMKKLTTVVIGKNVKTIGKNAFLNCKKLKTITIKTAKLTTKTVGASAFKGVHKKATVKVPAKKLKAYKMLLVKKGLPKTAKVKK